LLVVVQELVVVIGDLIMLVGELEDTENLPVQLQVLMQFHL
tara:strand:+ start:119 stop:241 length:123 start_codon:yes stop_codon:yes gene_type:complete